MIYYPIIIPTLNRFIHLKRCISSLALCSGSEFTELIIGLDYPSEEKHTEGHKNIKKYLPTIAGFKKVTVFEHKYNLGAYKNYIFLSDYALNKYDALIATEDDNEFAPCFLDFINKALFLYKDDYKVLSISGYTPECFYGISHDKVLFTNESCAWGIGLWKSKEKMLRNVALNNYYKNILASTRDSFKLFKTYPMLLSMLITMIKKETDYGDVERTTFNILNNCYQLRPTTSMSRNWGYDGSGVHCGHNKDNILSKQPILSDSTYELNYEKPLLTKGLRKALFFYGTDSNVFVSLWQISIIILRYIKYKIV